MTNAERDLLLKLAEVLCAHLKPEDDLYWEIKTAIFELERETEIEELTRNMTGEQ